MTATSGLRTILPEGWARAKGFSYGVEGADRRVVLIAGQLAVVRGAVAPEAGMPFPDQFIQCLQNVVDVVRSAGGDAGDVAALKVFVTSMADFKRSQSETAQGWASIFGRHFPAMTLIEVSALFEETALVEIEAVALIQGASKK
ncbi:RidA family protein [Bradyrhizobium sp. 2]|uniref:RidA family protein n=1 Tax=unclassified Bradyrhizobium TaxID=2631580 RepID=UPI001FF76D7F|nr:MULTISPECIES: RidA family protein [unclassified Bradyrhizobium]MCK1447072.1 RidA family protein [Bradyrhizobium sp. 48]MCK1464853.1 RidA family protein [Bradyrhizobium sp. 2]